MNEAAEPDDTSETNYTSRTSEATPATTNSVIDSDPEPDRTRNETHSAKSYVPNITNRINRFDLYYQAYKQPKASLEVVRSARKFMPTSPFYNLSSAGYHSQLKIKMNELALASVKDWNTKGRIYLKPHPG